MPDYTLLRIPRSHTSFVEKLFRAYQVPYTEGEQGNLPEEPVSDLEIVD